MEQGIIEADPRHTVRRMKIAMQGNVIRALVELITNADDSYIRLEDEKKPHKGTIEILYEKIGYKGFFAVRDYAEGMSITDVRESFKKYGAATSGLTKGKKVRGYFGQGAKDALASMENGKICTFNNGNFVECKLFIKNGKPMYEISDATPITCKLRNLHGIDGNGTVAYFGVDPEKSGRVPQIKSVHEEIANNYLLRKIMTSPKRKVFLLDKNSGETRSLHYLSPQGREVLSDDFTIKYGRYGDFPIHISIRRSEKGELTQIGDDRDGGLLLVDDQETVLGISLFRYDSEPLASRLFGEVRIGRFRDLLAEEETVLSEERDGLVVRHPFCKTLIPEIEKYIETKVNEERLRRQKEEQSKIDHEETHRYKKAFDLLNEIAEEEAEDTINLGQNLTDQPEEPANGFCFYPSSAQITVGKRYAFELRLDTKIVHHGSTIRISCANSKIRVVTPDIKVTAKDGVGILRKYIVVEGIEPNIKGTIRAVVGHNISQAEVFVVPEKELLLSEGMVFQPESVTVRPNQARKVYLLVYIKMIESGSKIIISSDNAVIHTSKNEIITNEFDATRNIAKYELDVWGEGAGQDAIITAEVGPYMALLDARVRSKEEQGEKSRKGMFSAPEFDNDSEPLQRTSYSLETGKVIIYVNFPSIKYYIGEACQYRKTLPAQILIADLVAERCFQEIAKKKVESNGVTLRAEAVPDRIQRDSFELSRKYGKRVHEALVDKNLIEDSRHVFK